MKAQGVIALRDPIKAISRADTGAYRVFLLFFVLSDDVGVGDVGPGHADEIENVLGNGVPGHGDVCNPAGVNEWGLNVLSKLIHLGEPGRQRRPHSRNMLGQGVVAFNMAEVNGHIST